jgi:hypothetical protein
MKKGVDEIIKNFDFVKVQKVMVALDWGYYNNGESPSVGELVLSAQEDLNYVLSKGEDWFTSSGGFEASVQDGILKLKFVVEDWEVDMEDK